MALLDSNIGLILHAVGEYDLSLRFLEKALVLNKKYYGSRSLKGTSFTPLDIASESSFIYFVLSLQLRWVITWLPERRAAWATSALPFRTKKKLTQSTNFRYHSSLLLIIILIFHCVLFFFFVFFFYRSVGWRTRKNEGIVRMSSSSDSASCRPSKEDEWTLSGSFGGQCLHVGTTTAAHSNPTPIHGLRLGYAQCHQRHSIRSNQVIISSSSNSASRNWFQCLH